MMMMMMMIMMMMMMMIIMIMIMMMMIMMMMIMMMMLMLLVVGCWLLLLLLFLLVLFLLLWLFLLFFVLAAAPVFLALNNDKHSFHFPSPLLTFLVSHFPHLSSPTPFSRRNPRAVRHGGRTAAWSPREGHAQQDGGRGRGGPGQRRQARQGGSLTRHSACHLAVYRPQPVVEGPAVAALDHENADCAQGRAVRRGRRVGGQAWCSGSFCIVLFCFFCCVLFCLFCLVVKVCRSWSKV